MAEVRVYAGVRFVDWNGHAGAAVTVNGKLLPLHCEVGRCHSPSGFAWGYAGSGPAQLALAILADHLEFDHQPEAAKPALTKQIWALHQDVKFQVITPLEQGKAWEMTSMDVDKVLASLWPEYTPVERTGEGVRLAYPPFMKPVKGVYESFIAAPVRAKSVERDQGIYWYDNLAKVVRERSMVLPPEYRGYQWWLSYIVDTGELYLVSMGLGDVGQWMIHLGIYRPDWLAWIADMLDGDVSAVGLASARVVEILADAEAINQ